MNVRDSDCLFQSLAAVSGRWLVFDFPVHFPVHSRDNMIIREKLKRAKKNSWFQLFQEISCCHDHVLEMHWEIEVPFCPHFSAASAVCSVFQSESFTVSLAVHFFGFLKNGPLTTFPVEKMVQHSSCVFLVLHFFFLLHFSAASAHLLDFSVKFPCAVKELPRWALATRTPVPPEDQGTRSRVRPPSYRV